MVCVIKDTAEIYCFCKNWYNTAQEHMLFELPPVSLKQFEKFFQNWTCEANAAGENSASILTVGVKSVPRYHFSLPM